MTAIPQSVPPQTPVQTYKMPCFWAVLESESLTVKLLSKDFIAELDEYKTSLLGSKLQDLIHPEDVGIFENSLSTSAESPFVRSLGGKKVK